MKKLLSLLLLLSLVLSLCACGGDDGAPDGFKLVSDRDSLGFALYIPEEWTSSSYGEIAAGYVSGLDTSSVSLVRVYPESGEDAHAYMHRTLGDIEFIEDGAPVLLGNAVSAHSYVYDRPFGELGYRIWQIIATTADGATYLFTYGASTVAKSEGVSYYDQNLERVKEIVKAVVFDAARDYTYEQIVYETDADGYKLISDKSVAGFSLYVPASYQATLQTGIVIAKEGDEVSVTCSEATSTGTSVKVYYNNRLKLLAEQYGVITELTELTTCPLANAKNAAYGVYSYTVDGVSYTTYQVVAVAGPILVQKGYVLTFTTTSDLYEQKLPEFQKMMEKLTFS